MLRRTPAFFCALLIAFFTVSSTALAQQRTPTDTMREFYQMMREKKFREAFGISIYRPAIEGLSAQEYEELRPDFEKMAIAVSERFPPKVEITGEQISGDAATVFVRCWTRTARKRSSLHR